MIKTCPEPVDVNDIQFKLHCSLKVFKNNNVETFQNNHSLISCASRYGLLFVGTNEANLKVIQLKTVENLTHKDKEITNYPRRNISLPSPPKHVCVNCDSTILAVVTFRDNCPIVIFYDVLSFYKININIIREVRLSATPGTFVTEVNWNPALSGIFTACKSDGTLGNYELKDNTIEINELPATVQCTSFCWSPKGKQLAVGSKKGHITQFKPDLKAVKVINAPSFEVPHSLISLCWISNYQFIGIYQSLELDGQAKLIVINAPKTGETNYINYEDVCYSGSSRMPQFYLILIQHWNILMISSSNSMELGLLGAASEIWTQWNVSDCARAELPLGPDKQETLPVGMALDISNTKPLPWGEGTIPPCPYLLLLSHQGIIYFYDIVNLKKGIPSICCPPDNISDVSGINQFVTNEEAEIKDSGLQTKSTFSFTPSQNPTVPASQPNPIFLPKSIPESTHSTFTFSRQATSQPILNIQQTPAPPNTSLLSKVAENKSLFGGQVTITPVKPQPQTSSMFGGSVNLTPVKPSQQNADSNVKYASILASLNNPSAVPASADAKPILVSAKTEPLESPKVITPEATRFVLDTQKIVMPETPKTTKPETPKSTMPDSTKLLDPKLVIDEKVKGETQALFAKMVKEECISIESELKAVLHQGRNININIGTNEEKVIMVKELQDFQEFIKEIVDVSLGESAEVHSLKQNLILSWAWYEEALSRYNVSKDETMSRILKSQPLDSATEKRKSDIQKIIYYLDSQLSQASRALDEQWDKFQDYTRKTHQIQMPTMEAIFQAMVRQNAILQKQSYILKDINGRIKQKKVSANTPSLFVGLNINRIEEDLKRLQLDSEDSHRIIYEKTLERQKKLSSSKIRKIKDLLKDREISHVTPVKPSLNYSRTKSPTSKTKHIFSILGAQMSPVAKPTVVKNLQFSESTPLKVLQDARPTTVPPNTPVQQDISKTFTFKSLDKNVASLPTSTFQPLPKASIISNFQAPVSSAFVPTTQASKNLVFSSVSPTTGTQVLKSTFSPPVTTSSVWSSNQLQLDNTNKNSEPLISSTGSSTKPIFNFDSSLSASKSETKDNMSVNISSSGFQTVGTASNTQTSFSFGKIPSTTTAPVAFKPAIPPSTVPVTTLATFQQLFSFGKTPIVSTPTTTPKTTNANTLSQISTYSPSSQTSVATVSITKPILAASSKAPNFIFSVATPQTTSTANTPKPTGIETMPTTTVKVVSNADVASSKTTSVNFGAVTTSLATITTQTNSLFGSIHSSSVTSSSFGPKIVVAPNSSNNNPITIVPSNSSSLFKTTPVSSENLTSKSIFTSSTTSLPITLVSPENITSKSIFTPTSTITPVSISPSTSSFMFAPAYTSSTSAPTISTSKSVFGTIATVSSTTSTPSIFSLPTASTSASPLLPSSTSISGGSPKQPSVLNINTTASTISTVSSPVNSTAVGLTNLNNSTASPSFINSTTITPTTKQISIIHSTDNATPADMSGNKVDNTQNSTNNAVNPTQSSIFGNIATATQSSIFSNTVTTTQVSVFSSPATSTQVSIFSTPTPQTSIFGGATPTTTPGSIFGNSTVATTASIFGNSTVATTASIFGNSTVATTASIFGNSAVTTTASIFGQTTDTQVLFSKSTVNPTTTNQSSNFGVTTTSQSSNFALTTGQSIFGTQTPSQSTVFSSPTTSNSIFGSPISTTQSTVFGNSSTTSQSVFGGPPVSSGSAFSNTQNSGFGVASTQSSIFGSSPVVSSASIFGTPNTTSGFNQSNNSVFGSSSFGSTTTPATTFGQPATFGSNSGSIFSTPTTANSVFGSGSLFGTPSTSSNTFGSGSTSAFSFAPAANNTGSSLGFGGLSVGDTPSTGNNIFGGNSTFGQAQQNPFSRSSNFETPATASGSIFGGSSASIFGSNTQSTFGSSFGSSGGFGQQTTFGQSTFGQQSTFGSPQPFSSGGSGVTQTGFGSPANFQKPGGFGAPPVFGGSPQPAFGGSPSFGGAPAFGGSPAFGSTSKVFGSTTPTASFGGADASNTGFGNLANQNTVGFGNLAQQASSPTSKPFSGNSSFSSWR